MQSILENILALYAYEWLDKRQDETSRAIGQGPGGSDPKTGRRILGEVFFDKRHEVYKDLQDRLMVGYPEVAEITSKLKKFC